MFALRDPDLTRPQAEVLKGDLYESDADFRFTRKMEISCGWTGDSSYDWNFTLDGYVFAPWLDSQTQRVVCLRHGSLCEQLCFNCHSPQQYWYGISLKERAIMFKKIPIVVKLTREADSKGRPFELHMSRCAKWCSGVDQAMRSSKSQLNAAGTSAGDAAAHDQTAWI